VEPGPALDWLLWSLGRLWLWLLWSLCRALHGRGARLLWLRVGNTSGGSATAETMPGYRTNTHLLLFIRAGTSERVLCRSAFIMEWPTTVSGRQSGAWSQCVTVDWLKKAGASPTHSLCGRRNVSLTARHASELTGKLVPWPDRVLVVCFLAANSAHYNWCAPFELEQK